MAEFTLKQLAWIIERDSKDSTYKFALLRGTIDLIQDFPHYRQFLGDRIAYPMGLLVLKWIEYYYPIIASEKFIPQKHGDNGTRTIAFRKEFEELTSLYKSENNHHGLLYDLKKGIRDESRIKIILGLVRKLRDTITKQPMHYIGGSIGMQGEIYQYWGTQTRQPQLLDLTWVIEKFGFFSVPIEFHHVLRDVGLFVSGTNSIIFKWAEFTSNLSKSEDFSSSDIISLLSNKENERDVLQSKNFYNNILANEGLICVWSGKHIHSGFHVDHMLPYSVLKNNDLWNLLPTTQGVNSMKSDDIPDPHLLLKSEIKERIIYYWEILKNDFEDQFIREIKTSILGKENWNSLNWQKQCYDGLIDLSNHLINERGLTPWYYKK